MLSVMTSSEKPNKTDSIPENESSITMTHSRQKDTLDGSIADDAADNTEKSDTHQDADESTADAKAPEAEIKMESISEDVVVVTLESSEPEPEIQSSDEESASVSKSEQGSDFFQPDADISEAAEHTSQEDANANAEVTVEAESEPATDSQNAAMQSTDKKIAGKPKTNIKSNDNHQNKSNVSQDSGQDTDTESDKAQDSDEEEGQKEKEDKLESYKQFVAEQFSNQKVDYPEVRVRIEANALPSKMYFIMNILSAIIASYGLVTNSAAVVIGAMLVAMMLGPITGVALAIIDHRMPLLRKSLITVIAGVSLVVLVGFIVGWLHKDQPLTAEILSRTQPTSMDLMIALAGGTAGAYAMVSPHLSVAVVGVAVATALVPPLAASGILFANGEMQLGLGALLLAVTNIIAIQFTNALVLWLLGFRRLVDDDYKSNTYLTFLQRNAVTLLLLGALGAYLTINLQTNAKQQVFESSVKETINSYFIGRGNVLTNTQFDTLDDNQVVRAVIRGETLPTSEDVRKIETIITQDMADNFPDYLPIKLQLRYLPVQVIESNPLVTDKLDKTDAAILTN
ncbi:TIGR00341 family protein [Psychrobacter sp. NG27]|nr:TIGR00341 family protein [Psychrobacter sp. NG27]